MIAVSYAIVLAHNFNLPIQIPLVLKPSSLHLLISDFIHVHVGECLVLLNANALTEVR